MKVLPTPHRVVDAQGRQWAAYDLDQAKQLMVFDDELHSLRIQRELWLGIDVGWARQVLLLRELLDKEKQKYDLLNARFLEKSQLLDLTIEEKNRFKYRRSWALFGGRSTLLTALATIGVGYALAR